MKKPLIVGIGDLSADIYLKDNEVVGLSGGGSIWNSLAYCAYNGCTTKAIGVCGKDLLGDFCISELKKFGVNTQEVHQIGVLPTRRMFIIESDKGDTQGSKYCPTNNQSKWYENGQFDTVYPTILDKKKGMMIADNIESGTYDCLMNAKHAGWSIGLNLAHIGALHDMSNNDIVTALSSGYDIIQLKARVLEFLLDKLELKDRMDVIKMLNCPLIIVTMGIDGWCTYYKDSDGLHARKYRVRTPELKDSTGLFDLLFGCVINTYADEMFYKQPLDYNFCEALYQAGYSVLSKTASEYGARSYNESLTETLHKNPEYYLKK